MYITPLFLNIMENESFEKAKALKKEITECDSLLDSILKSSRECCVYRDTRIYITVEKPRRGKRISGRSIQAK